MYQKDYFKNANSKGHAENSIDKSAPFYKLWSGKLQPLTAKNPKLTIAMMLLFATVNFLIMLYVVNSRPAKSLIPKDIIKNISRTEQRQSAPYTIANYMKVSELKDSLDYLMRLPKLTKTDSLLFIKICDEYAKLDPSFSQSLKKVLNKKSSTYEKPNP